MRLKVDGSELKTCMVREKKPLHLCVHGVAVIMANRINAGGHQGIGSGVWTVSLA